MRYRFIFLLLITLVLSACVSVKPEQVGLSTVGWESLSYKEKEKISSTYRKTEKTRQQWLGQMRQNPNNQLTVTIAPGKAYFPPYLEAQEFLPVIMNLTDGKCYQDVQLLARDNPLLVTNLSVCYYQNILYLDPSFSNLAEAKGSLVFPYLPVWQRGFSYPNISSNGLVRLSNARITIQILKAPDVFNQPS